MWTTRIQAVGLALLMSVFLVACEQEGPAERAGEKLDEATENLGDQVEDAGDEVKDCLSGNC